MKAAPSAVTNISELSLTIFNTKRMAGMARDGVALASQLTDAQEQLCCKRWKKKKKMCLFCCIRKAGREHAERTVWCDDFVLFSVLSLEGIKIFHTAANLKALELEKK